MFTVKLKVDNEEQLYNAYDPDKKQLSEDIKGYLISTMSKRKIGDDVEVHIISADTIDQNNINQSFQEWIEEEILGIKKEYKKNLIQQLWMFGIGVVFIALSIVIESYVNVVWFTVLSTIGSFSMWEAASVWIVQNPSLRLRKRIFEKLKNKSKIIIETD